MKSHTACIYNTYRDIIEILIMNVAVSSLSCDKLYNFKNPKLFKSYDRSVKINERQFRDSVRKFSSGFRLPGVVSQSITIVLFTTKYFILKIEKGN